MLKILVLKQGLYIMEESFSKKVTEIKTTPFIKCVRNYHNVDKLFTFSQEASSASLTSFKI